MRLLICVCILFSFNFALAKEKTKKKVVYRKSQDVSFDEASIKGQVRSPDGAYLSQKSGMDFVPLYEVREDFDRRIKDSVEYLR